MMYHQTPNEYRHRGWLLFVYRSRRQREHQPLLRQLCVPRLLHKSFVPDEMDVGSERENRVLARMSTLSQTSYRLLLPAIRTDSSFGCTSDTLVAVAIP